MLNGRPMRRKLVLQEDLQAQRSNQGRAEVEAFTGGMTAQAGRSINWLNRSAGIGEPGWHY